MQGLGIITPTHSLSPGIRASWEYRERGAFVQSPRTTGGREGRMKIFLSGEATILDRQIVRMHWKWLISSGRCQIWQIRAWGHGQFFSKSCQFDRSDNIDRWTCQISEFFVRDWQVGPLSIFFDSSRLTDQTHFRDWTHLYHMRRCLGWCALKGNLWLSVRIYYKPSGFILDLLQTFRIYY